MKPACVLALGLCAALLGCGESDPHARRYAATFDSQSYEIDRIYRSMKGPQGTGSVQLGDPGQLLWITAYQAQIVDGQSGEPVSAEFMCHSNLNLIDMPVQRKLLGWEKSGQPRLFTVSQGQMEVRFPEGFAIPIVSDARLALATQVLNLNPQDMTLSVRHRTTIEFLRDAELREPPRPLFTRGVQGLVLVEGDVPYFGIDDPDAELHGPGCAVGDAAGSRVIEDPFGRRFAAHWIVPPGRQVHRTLVTEQLNLPFDTTIHYIAVHLHPFAVSLALRDLTTGETLFESRAQGAAGKIGLVHVDPYASGEGIPVFQDHQYELMSVYDNTSGEDQDAMAVLYLYLLDHEFDRARARERIVAARAD
jgi:hypothetical protein